MGNAIFLLATTVALLSAIFKLRPHSREGLGFALCCCLYVIFAAGFFIASSALVVSLWLVLAVANMVMQYRALPKQLDAGFAPVVLLASLFIWPVQLPALRISQNDEAAESLAREKARARLGALPSTVSGTVSFTHHIDSEVGEEMVWLEEYEALEFWLTSELFERIGIAEGRRASLSVEERAEPGDQDRTLWIIDGSVLA
jgi:hypothetical protein